MNPYPPCATYNTHLLCYSLLPGKLLLFHLPLIQPIAAHHSFVTAHTNFQYYPHSYTTFDLSNTMNMKNLTNTDLMIVFEKDNIKVEIFWNGGQYCSYKFYIDSTIQQSGNDFKPSPLHNVDDLQTIVSLLGFLTVRPGDTDPEYFKNHTPEYLEWLDTHECDDLNAQINDFADSDTNYHADALEYFQAYTKIWPND